MDFLQLLRRDRRVVLTALLAGLALLAGIWLLPLRLAVQLAADGAHPFTPGELDGLVNEKAISAAVKSGYWVMLGTLALFVRAAWRVARESWRARRPGRIEAGALALVLAGGAVLLAHEQQGFKILEDEVLLLGTSMSMHLDRLAAYPVRAHDVQGPFHLTQHVLDKRPFFFPFLVALTHDLTGYRPTNPFYVNAALGFGLLAMVWLLGRNIGGSPWAGAGAVLLFTGLPLLAQQMAGGGMDLLNLVMLAAVVWLAREFAVKRAADTQEALVLGAVLLAYSRYESVLFLLPVAVLVLWAWWHDGRVTLTWPVMIAPLLLLPWLWQNRTFEVNAGAWELGSHPGAVAPFALGYAGDNLGNALAFFFDVEGKQFFSGYQASSPVFSALGLLALPVFGLWIVRVLRAPRQATPADMALAVCGAGLFGLTALLMCYFLGLNNPIVHRLALPTYLLMTLAIVTAGKLAWQQRGWGRWLVGVALVSLVTQGLPVMARRAYEADYSPGIQMAWRQEFLRRYPEKDYMFIDQDSVFWIVNHVVATPVEQARLRKPDLAFQLRNHTFAAIYVFQTFQLNPDTGEPHLYTPDPNKPSPDELGPDFELETVWEHRIETLLIGRISRVKTVWVDGRPTTDTGLASPSPGPGLPLSSDELEAAKPKYMESLIRHLP